MKLLLNKALFFSLFGLSLFGENFEYKSGDIHTLTQIPNKMEVNLQYILLNDVVDMLNFKSKEFDSSTANAIGDMDGYKAKLTYGISDNLMVRYTIARENFEYSGNKIKNTMNEIFIRKNLFQKDSFSGVSFDIGAISNQLGDYYISDIDDINELSKRYYPEKDYKLELSNNSLYAISGNNTTTLYYNPWVGLEDTNDMSFYCRAITGLNSKNKILDLYVGIKKTKINNKIVANQELVDVAASYDINIEKNLARDEIMYFTGVSGSYDGKIFGIEYSYEYNKFKRDSGLDYVDYNHIIDVTLDYKYSKDLVFYTGGRAMYRQLNGQIPYLYNKYTQTTYDHKYGYARAGIIYRY